MAYIESHQSLRDHWKTKKFARLLDIPKMSAIGHLHGLWWWSMDCSRNGSLAHLEHIDIATGCDWEGDPEKLVEALVKSQFLDFSDFSESGSESGLSIHNWHLYGGKLQAKRESDRLRKQKERTISGSPSDIQRTAQVEKSRVDKSKKNPLGSKKPARVQSEIPEEWKPNQQSRELAIRYGIPESEIDNQVFLMKRNYENRGALTANPASSWATWCSKYTTYNGPTSNGKSSYVHPSQWNTEGTM